MAHHHDVLTGAYGFGLFPVPVYREASRGNWRIATHLPSLADGYLSPPTIEARAVLTRGREVWMSTGLLEQESHAWHVHCAEGIVVTAGLGMGMYVYAAAMKQSVHLVIAADMSRDMISLMRQSTDFDHWPCRHKVILIEADVLDPDFAARVSEYTGARPIDYFYADIWTHFPAAEAPGQTAEMAGALVPQAAGWWGQELSFAQSCRLSASPADEESLRRYFTEIGVPAPRITSGYAAFCRNVMAAYGMGQKKPFWQRLRNSIFPAAR